MAEVMPTMNAPSNETENVRPPHKRRKIGKALDAADETPKFAKASSAQLGPRVQNAKDVTTSSTTTTTGNVQVAVLSPELSHLHAKYEITSMSIISSSKINQKVDILLTRLSKFTFADPNAKPGVVALYAKANVASKMISIVEITKGNIQRDGGKWWAYSKVHGQIEELKVRTNGSGKNAKGDISKPWASDADVSKDGDQQMRGNEGILADDAMQVDEVAADQDEDDGAFQTMEVVNQPAEMSTVEARKKVRAIPIMTIYMSRVPINELKELYGEQTNA
ncbi:hypothetical protein MMC09_005337 [Bachmanniomyces sp. S44760]|nr:hypothetical protein [Bachmanniomyces sp. S44760]